MQQNEAMLYICKQRDSSSLETLTWLMTLGCAAEQASQGRRRHKRVKVAGDTSESRLQATIVYNQDSGLLKLGQDTGDDDFMERSIRGDPFLRFGKGDPFLRFGRGDPFLRFGRGDPFLRFGRGDPFLRFGRGDPFLRFGRGDPFLRFGRGDPFLRFGRGDPFLRFGRGDPFLRFGRGDPFLRFGRGDPFLRFGRGDPFLRFGRDSLETRVARGDPFLRFGRDSLETRVARGDPFLRFGRFKPPTDTEDNTIDLDDEDISRRSAEDKSSRRKREASAELLDSTLAKRSPMTSASEAKEKPKEKRLQLDIEESRSTRSKPYMRFGRDNLSPYDLEEDNKETLLDEEFSRFAREPSRISYPRYGKRSDKGPVYMRFGRPAGSDYMASENTSQKR
ncbi:FMRFamide [Biomphalaria glabrata]|nr:FMRFamide FMRF-amide neuropeptides-like P Neuropeptide/Reproduction [Biomphalaria glabrata]